jgi:molybdopterin-containing oxidoreductase family membrane subunit
MQTETVAVEKKSVAGWLFLSLLVAAVGLYGMMNVYSHGQEEVYNISREVPWGLLIIGYAFFVAVSVGTATISAIAHVFKVEAFHVMSKKVAMISLASLIGAFYLIFWELAGPFDLQALRLMVYFTEFKVTSPIWWMVTFYMLELPLLALEVYFLASNKHGAAFFAAMIGFFLGIIAYGTLSFVFASNATHPLWHTSGFSLFFILSAIASGVGVILIALFFNKRTHNADHAVGALSKTLFILLFFMLFMNVWNVFIDIYGADSELSATIELFIGQGVLSSNFYYAEIIAGILVPMLLILMGGFRSFGMGALAGLLAVVGVFFARYDSIVGGQFLTRPSSNMDFVLHHYFPSLSELALFTSGVGVAFVVYFIGSMIFNLEEEAHA